MTSHRITRLAHPRIQAEVAHQLARRGEPADVANGGDEGRCCLDIDTGHRHQPLDFRPGQRGLSDRPIQCRYLTIEELDLAQAAIEGEPLVDGQLQRGDPRYVHLCRTRR